MQQVCNALLQCVQRDGDDCLSLEGKQLFTFTSCLLPDPCKMRAPWRLGCNPLFCPHRQSTYHRAGTGGGAGEKDSCCSPSPFHEGGANCTNTEGKARAQVEAARGAEQEARVAAEEVEALRRTISQLPRPTMSSRSETSITLSLARLAKSSGEDKVRSALAAASMRSECSRPLQPPG